ncbi:MAG: hypothetical protein EP330_26480 [Deltaproteobacteria bacterium]|nr:MAG: hypothetical protein EP330_26480 [Deltaproteobacteria bacterium]
MIDAPHFALRAEHFDVEVPGVSVRVSTVEFMLVSAAWGVSSRRLTRMEPRSVWGRLGEWEAGLAEAGALGGGRVK